MTENSNEHDSEDCVEGLCDHPEHQLSDGTPDLNFLLEHPASRVLEPDLVMGPVFL